MEAQDSAVLRSVGCGQKPRGCWEVIPEHPVPSPGPPTASGHPRSCLGETRLFRLPWPCPAASAQVSAASADGAGSQRSNAVASPLRGASAFLSLDVPICEVGGGRRLLPDPPLFAPKHTQAPHSSKKLFLSYLNNVKMPREGLNQRPLQGPGWGGEGRREMGGPGPRSLQPLSGARSG